MKIFLFTLLVLFNSEILSKELSILPVNDGKIIYQKVVEVDTKYTDSDIFNAVKTFLSSNNLHRKTDAGYSTGMALLGGVQISPAMGMIEANNRNRETFVSEDPPKNIRVNYYQAYQGRGAGALRTLYIDSDLKIDTKNGRYRYTLTNFNWTHYNHFTGEQAPIWGNRSENCNDRGSLYQLHTLCKKGTRSRKAAMELIHQDVSTFLKDLEGHVISELDNIDGDDNW